MVLVFMRSYPWRSAVMLVCLLFAGVSESIGIATLLPFLNIIVGGVDHGSRFSEMIGNIFAAFDFKPTIGLLLIIMVTGILLKSGFKLLAMKQVGYTVAYVVTELRFSLLRSVLKARWDHFIKHPIGIFTNAISTEAVRLSDGYRFSCLILSEAIQVLFYLIISLFISWQVTLVALFVGLVIIFILIPLVKKSRRAGLSQTGLFQSLLVRLTELLNGIKPIKAMAREKDLGPLLQSEANDLKIALQQQVLSIEALKTLQEPVLIVFMALGIYFIVTYWNVPMSNLLIMALLFQRSVFTMGKLQKQYQAMAVCESAFWSFNKTMKEVEAASEILSGEIPPNFEDRIDIKNLRFSYGDRNVINNVSFTVSFGKLTVITGPSGAGKTTIVDILTGLLTPQGGDVYLDGISLKEIDLLKWRHMIGYVPQEMFLFHESVRDNITLGDRSIPDADIEDALKKAYAWDFVTALPHGWDTTVGERGGRISGGQRQRIAIARALVRKPKLLILDEVTTALDPETEKAVCSSMAGLKGETAVLAISHQPSIISIADVVYRIENGRVRII